MVCYLCGEKGHKIANCPKRSGGMQIKCNYCGRNGNGAERCFHHPSNLPTSPAWIRRMHGLDEVEARNKKDDEVGAFAFMHPASAANDGDEVSFALFEDEVKEQDTRP